MITISMWELTCSSSIERRVSKSHTIHYPNMIRLPYLISFYLRLATIIIVCPSPALFIVRQESIGLEP